MPRRALIVDDEPAMCELIQSVLNSAGIDSLALTKSEEAAGPLNQEKFDVVFLDMCMPAPDGINVARQIRSGGINQKTPIIMTSENQNLSAVSQGFEAGASFFLYKPVDRGNLVRLVRATRGTIEYDRRRFRRVDIRSKVILKGDEGEIEGETINLSLGGILLKCPRIFPVGSSLQFRLFLEPGKKPVIGFLTLMSVRDGNLMGMQFERMLPAETEKLQEFLLHQMRED